MLCCRTDSESLKLIGNFRTGTVHLGSTETSLKPILLNCQILPAERSVESRNQSEIPELAQNPLQVAPRSQYGRLSNLMWNESKANMTELLNVFPLSEQRNPEASRKCPT